MILSHNFIDESGLSYYGNNTLSLLRWEKGKWKKRNITTMIGAIHAIVWAPDCKSFTVISGSMPARIIFYNEKGDPDFTIGKQHIILINDIVAKKFNLFNFFEI